MSASSWLNTSQAYGWIAILLHWFMAVLLLSLYGLGNYMVGLDYYHPWYHDSLSVHKAMGVIAAGVLLLRFFWNWVQPRPAMLNPEHVWQNRLARLGHGLLYLLPVVLVVSGYLISTSEGQGIDVFGWFELPALLADDTERGELAGKIHALTATVFVLMVAFHVLAALIHHFFYKDDTLRRMLRIQGGAS